MALKSNGSSRIFDAGMALAPLFRKSTALLVAVDSNLILLTLVGLAFAQARSEELSLLEHPALLSLVIILPAGFHLAGLYDLRRYRSNLAETAFRTFAVTAGILVLFCLAHRLACGESLLQLAAWSGLLVPLQVLTVRWLASSRDEAARPADNVLIVGAGWTGRLALDTILRHPKLHLRVKGIIDDSPQKRNFSYKGVPVLGNWAVLKDAATRHDARLIIVAISTSQTPELINSLIDLKMAGTQVVDMPSFYERVTGQIPVKHAENSWFIYNGGFDILHNIRRQRIKRVIDILASACCLLLSLPLMAIIAVLVKLESRGPVFCRQDRVGLNERVFPLLKFRTTFACAGGGADSPPPQPKGRGVTRIGRLLRLTRLDEIPQFLNVLKGDMSCVGPRPEQPRFVERLKLQIPYYAFRFAVRPGLSGWAQVRHRYSAGADDALEKFKYDLYYIKNMSGPLDFYIMLKTLEIVLTARGV